MAETTRSDAPIPSRPRGPQCTRGCHLDDKSECSTQLARCCLARIRSNGPLAMRITHELARTVAPDRSLADLHIGMGLHSRHLPLPIRLLAAAAGTERIGVTPRHSAPRVDPTWPSATPRSPGRASPSLRSGDRYPPHPLPLRLAGGWQTPPRGHFYSGLLPDTSIRP